MDIKLIYVSLCKTFWCTKQQNLTIIEKLFSVENKITVKVKCPQTVNQSSTSMSFRVCLCSAVEGKNWGFAFQPSRSELGIPSRAEMKKKKMEFFRSIHLYTNTSRKDAGFRPAIPPKDSLHKHSLSTWPFPCHFYVQLFQDRQEILKLNHFLFFLFTCGDWKSSLRKNCKSKKLNYKIY